MKSKKVKPQPEKNIENRIIDYLQAQHYLYATKINNSVAFSRKTGGYLKRGKRCMNGIPDIFLWGNFHGVHFSAFIEVKTKAGRLSDNQKLFMQRYQDTGGYMAVCRSIEDAISFLADIDYRCQQKKLEALS